MLPFIDIAGWAEKGLLSGCKHFKVSRAYDDAPTVPTQAMVGASDRGTINRFNQDRVAVTVAACDWVWR